MYTYNIHIPTYAIYGYRDIYAIRIVYKISLPKPNYIEHVHTYCFHIMYNFV